MVLALHIGCYRFHWCDWHSLNAGLFSLNSPILFRWPWCLPLEYKIDLLCKMLVPRWNVFHSICDGTRPVAGVSLGKSLQLHVRFSGLPFLQKWFHIALTLHVRHPIFFSTHTFCPQFPLHSFNPSGIPACQEYWDHPHPHNGSDVHHDHTLRSCDLAIIGGRLKASTG